MSRLLAVALAAVLLVAACDSTTTSPAPALSSPPALPSTAPSVGASPAASLDADAIYDAVEQQVVAIRGLKPSKPVARQFIDSTELRTLVTKMFDEDTPPAYLAASERLFKALALIPADSNLREFTEFWLGRGLQP